MGKAHMTVTAELLAMLFGLPKDSQIEPRDIHLLVSHPDIPSRATRVEPVLRRFGDGLNDVVFVEWGATDETADADTYISTSRLGGTSR